MSFKETFAAFDAEEKAIALAEDRYREAQIMWNEIQTRRSKMFPEPEVNRTMPEPPKDNLDKIAGFIRRAGPASYKYFAGPATGAAAASIVAEEGSYSGIINLVKQIFGFGVGQ